MFERIWKSIRGDGSAETIQEDRRAHPRHPLNLETTCQSVSDERFAERVQIRDISRGGINFSVAKKLEPGTLVRIALPPTEAGESEMLACVMHASAQADGGYAVGCAFSDELGDEELRQFGGRKELAHGTDKRAWTRFPAHGFVDYLQLPPTGEPAKQAEIANISASGIGMFLEEKIEPGTILDLLLKTKSGQEAFDILACVVFLGRRSEGGWVAGCHFIRELEDADLKRLM